MSTKLNQEVTDRICGALVRGASIEAAAAEASIGYSTLRRWLSKGRAEDAEEPYLSFYAEVEEATNRSEIHLLEKIRSAEDWRASAWILSRRFPDRWSESAQSRYQLTVNPTARRWSQYAVTAPRGA